MRTHLSWSMALLAVVLLAVPVQAQITINEVRINQPGADGDEYFELSGPPSTSLNGLTYLVIGDGAGGSGTIEAVVDLDGNTIGGSGYFLVTESTFTLLGATADLVANLNFENSDNVTHMLVSEFIGADGQDLDTNDDCVLDLTPWTSVLDLVAVIIADNAVGGPPVGESCHYGDLTATPNPTAVGPDGTFAPGHAFRLPDTSGPWQVGAFEVPPDPAGVDTPGAENKNLTLSDGVTLAQATASAIDLDLASQVNGGTGPFTFRVLAAPAAGTLNDGATNPITVFPHTVSGTLQFTPPNALFKDAVAVSVDVTDSTAQNAGPATHFVMVQDDAVVISEIMHFPNGGDANFGYIEVYNYSAGTINLWGLGGNLFSGPATNNLAGASIGPNSFKIIAASNDIVGDEAFRCDWKLAASDVITVSPGSWQRIQASTSLVALYEDTGGTPSLLDAVFVNHSDVNFPDFNSPDDIGHALSVTTDDLFFQQLTSLTNDSVFGIPPWKMLGTTPPQVAENLQVSESGLNTGNPGFVPDRNPGYIIPAVGCPTGKCCLPDGSCEVRFELDCTTDGCGTWTSGGDCTAPTGCTVLPTGGCCIDAGDCFDITACECAAINGTFDAINSCAQLTCPINIGVLINEVDYDNPSLDDAEFIELIGPPTTDLTGWTLQLYEGDTGLVDSVVALSGAIPADRFYLVGPTGMANVDLSFPFATNNLENGPDGIALVDNLGVVQDLLAYELSFVGAAGPANGQTFPNIGDDDSRGGSLQRIPNAQTFEATPGLTPGASNSSFDNSCKTVSDLRLAGPNVGAQLCNVVATVTDNMSGSASFTSIYVQDNSGPAGEARGIQLNGTNAEMSTFLTAGSVLQFDQIDLLGTTDQFFETFRFQNGEIPLQVTVNAGQVAPPAPVTVALQDMVDNSPRAEELESTLVQVDCVTFPAAGQAFLAATNYDLEDGSGLVQAVRIANSTLDLAGSIIPSGYVNVAGIITQFNAEYNIRPRSQADITPCAVPPTGACCAAIGTTCTVTDWLTCSTAGDIYQGDNTTCTPNPCQPSGSCCLPTGVCIITDEANCLAQGGLFDGNPVNGCVGVVCNPSISLTINEVRIDQSGADNDEYFEIHGPPGTPLTGLSYVVIGDGFGLSGSVESVTSLDGQTIPADGFFLAGEAAMTLATPDLPTVLNFENGDNVTHLLVAGFTGNNGDDLDTNDDCILDVTPWTSEFDRIALVEADNGAGAPPPGTECHYGDFGALPNPTAIGPDGLFVPGHVFRNPDDGPWDFGLFDPIGLTDTAGVSNVVNGACCLPDGSCINTDAFECIINNNGLFSGIGSACAGDANSNGIDDACESAPCDACGPNLDWVRNCSAGQDAVPTSALVGIDTNLDCNPDVTATLSGPVVIDRTAPLDQSINFPGTGALDGIFDVIDTEIVAMNLTDGTNVLVAGGGLGAGGALTPSLGTIVEQVGNSALADSFFDVFFEINLGGQILYNQAPVQVQAVIDCVPPEVTFVFPNGCLPLFDAPVGGAQVANLISVDHQTFPPAGPAPCVATAARSCQLHTEGRLCLDLDVPPGSGGSNVEPRLGQPNDIEIDLDITPASVAVASVDCTDLSAVTTSHLADVATTTLVGSTVNVTFAPALPDNQVCVITLDCGASVCVQGLRGDVDRNGTVTTGDASQVRFFFNDPANGPGGPQWDLDMVNGVTTGDFSQIRFFFNATVPACP